jgi:hypothetical protein
LALTRIRVRGTALQWLAGASTFLFAATPLAHAQSCTTSGTSPYQTCTTWQGPQLITSSVPSGGQGQYTWGPLQPFDITGAGLGGFMQNWGKQLALNAGGSFSTQTPPTIGISFYLCYMGNFDGSGRSGMACLADGSIGYSLSNGTSLATPTTQTIASGNYLQTQFIDPIVQRQRIGNTVDPCLVMDVDGDGTDDIVCGGSVLPTYDNPAGALNNNWGIYRWNGNGFTYSVWTSPGVYSVGFTCIQGQFTGDGLGGLACHQTGGSASWSMLHSTGTGWAVENWASGPVPSNVTYGTGATYNTGAIITNCTNPPGFTNLTCIISPGCAPGTDLNGDGMTDLICQSVIVSGTTGAAIGFAGSAGAFKSLLTLQSFPYQMPIFAATTDLYGTGLSGELVSLAQGSTEWTYSTASFLNGGGISYATTSFNLAFPVGAPPPGGPDVDWNQGNSCVVQDLNGDGIEDIACQAPSSSSPITGNGTWNVALSTRPQ